MSEIKQLDIGCVWVDISDQKGIATSLTPFKVEDDGTIVYTEHYSPVEMLEKLKRAKQLMDLALAYESQEAVSQDG